MLFLWKVCSMLTATEENYLKAIFKISESGVKAVTTNAVAAILKTKAASVTDMMKRLSEKGLVEYEKYKGALLTLAGARMAKSLIRRHRLWEVFLVDKLDFTWDEVHVIAEQLEHIRSPLLAERLDTFLGYPKFDPHGDPIPDEQGNIRYHDEVSLFDVKPGGAAIVVGVKDSSANFLKYLDQIGIGLGARIKVIQAVEYDQSREVLINLKFTRNVSRQLCQNLYVNRLND